MSTEVLQCHLASIARLAPLIEAHADSAEQLRRLPPPVVRALVEAGLFKLYLPRSLGGSELEPLEFAECLEAISRIDGSAGWCVFIGNVNTLFTSPMVPESIEAIFANQPEVVTGSAFFPFGRALRCDGGHRVSGLGSSQAAASIAAGISCCARNTTVIHPCFTTMARHARAPASCRSRVTPSTKPGTSAAWPAPAVMM